MIERFLRRHDVDVGRFLAAITLSGAVTRVFDDVGTLLAGRIIFDVGVPIAVIVGIGLWQHRPWARWLVVILTWLAAALFTVLVAAVLVGTRLNITVTFGNTTFAHPTRLQAIVFGCMALPLTTLMLVVLNSGKVREEFTDGATPKPASPEQVS